MKASDYLFDHQAAMISDLEKLVNMETPSGNKLLLDRCARYLEDYFQDNITCKVSALENISAGNNLLVRFNLESKLKPVLLLAHYDTVFPVGTIERRPFSVSEDGEMARGPGVFDMKAGLVQAVWALKALEKHGNPGRPVTLLVTSDEETGSDSSRKVIEGMARESEAVLVLEPSLNGNLKTERKGVGDIDIRFIGKASHAGLDPSKGASAINEAARMVQFLQTLNRQELETTVNVGTINGGTARNVIPGEAFMQVDFRIVVEEEGDRIMKEVKKFRPKDSRVRIEVRGGVNRPPMRKTPDSGRLFSLAKKIGQEFGRDLKETSAGGGSDGNFCAALGVPVLDGLGAVGDGAHSDQEVLDVNEMPVRAAILERLLEEI